MASTTTTTTRPARDVLGAEGVLPGQDAAGPSAGSDIGLAKAGQYLTFSLGGGTFGAAITRVQEILEYEELTYVPGIPAWIPGVLGLRGSVVPVVDLAVKFGLEPTAITPRTCVVITEVRFEDSTSIMGILADEVSQVVQFASKDIQPAPKLCGEHRVDYLQGVARNGKSFVLLLNVDELLLGEEMLTVELLAGTDGSSEPYGESSRPQPEDG